MRSGYDHLLTHSPAVVVISAMAMHSYSSRPYAPPWRGWHIRCPYLWLSIPEVLLCRTHLVLGVFDEKQLPRPEDWEQPVEIFDQFNYICSPLNAERVLGNLVMSRKSSSD